MTEPEAAISTQAAGIARNLAGVRARLDAAAPGRAVILIAVSKTHGVPEITAALQAGQRVFGENRVQEAQAKWPPLRDIHRDLELHLIGPLQTNKVAQAVALFDVIETLDRPKLARALASAMTMAKRRPRCYVQVNTGEEPQKAGIAPREADAFIALCRGEFGLPVTGVMCIPPHDEEPSPHFALLAKIARRNQLPEISMGMSGDFEIAAAFGATHVRVGTAIFGARES